MVVANVETSLEVKVDCGGDCGKDDYDQIKGGDVNFVQRMSKCKVFHLI